MSGKEKMEGEVDQPWLEAFLAMAPNFKYLDRIAVALERIADIYTEQHALPVEVFEAVQADVGERCPACESTNLNFAKNKCYDCDAADFGADIQRNA